MKQSTRNCTTKCEFYIKQPGTFIHWRSQMNAFSHWNDREAKNTDILLKGCAVYRLRKRFNLSFFFFFLANASFDPGKTHYIATGFYMPNAEDKGKKWLFGVLTCRCASKSTFADIAIKTLFDFHVSTSTSIMTLELRQKLVRWNYLPSIVMHDCICSELSFF